MTDKAVQVLEDIFNDRLTKRNKYSLRKYAEDLNLSPSFLGRILKGKRRLSLEKAFEIADRLGLDSKKRELFFNYVRSPSDTFKKDNRIDPKYLTENAFTIVSVWYHYAITELTYKPGFDNTIDQIADSLGISKGNAKMAVDRLLRVKMLSRDQNGRLVKTNQNFATKDIPSEALRSRHKQVLEKAHRAIDSQDFDERINTGMTFCIDKKKIPEARKKIFDFVQEMSVLMENGDKDEVYELSVSLFSLEQ
ncbi:TIGR02147 family protein [Pseudobacteriovorax antillogorgiicola]|uniref:TIGR02147 family protein n=1 Tax=Pseudobacteriovorax antillogorgiicola TaxID=1513793 RepID=A0A1Y6CYQ3_9BACT|nr:TIGR02147 family protein [Pseudobacteriovorax antillogorgiicola]TCS41791.1 uncharacterized protein (TIGR02147 family) [Pseudobacteriovorax antillogorgiicola]SMF83503.1 TIGR02147 family protein [Pseudobacteriovorax antillogorgiicola]